ncbi:MAG: PhoH family protein [Planctomycetaceae bacterium]|nr:PhoH family protein [Planctomycetaceae bacterium]
MTEARIPLEGQAEAQALFGPQDDYLRQVRRATGAKIVLKGSLVVVSGEEDRVEACQDLLRRLRMILRTRGELTESDVREAISPDEEEEQMYEDSEVENAGEIPVAAVAPKNRDIRASRQGGDRVGQIRPRTKGQEGYLDAMTEKSLVFCDGPAGCGKTFLAVAMALKALRDEEVRKIVLVRPAVEAGEKLGFLPGDMFAKVNPFVRPLLDAMHDMLDFDQVRRYMANDVIEIAPLAFMRGRTLNDTFMILDEGQNTTITQMKMFLTRMGTNSRIVVTGDATQNDLPKGTRSGLEDGIRRLSGIDGVAIVKLTGQDIVRHRLVREIVSAYEADDSEQ